MGFGELDYQPRARTIITRAIENRRIAHAYLFAGPVGVGKHVAARLFAQAINCDQPDAPCGECASCRKIARSMDPTTAVHPDILHLMPGTWEADGRKQASYTIVIDAVRELCRKIYSAPLEAKWRVVFIHDVDRMQIAAQNAFLKTLEEPLQKLRTVFVLLSPRPLSLLPTIRSRCQTVTFAPVRQSFIENRLVQSLGVEPLRAQEIAAFADGNLARALEIASNTEGASDEEVQRREWIEAWSHIIDGADIAELESAAGRSRDTMEMFLGFLVGWQRDLLLIAQNGDVARLINKDQRERLIEQAARSSPDILVQRIEHIEQAMASLKLNVRVDLVLDDLVLPVLMETGQMSRR